MCSGRGEASGREIHEDVAQVERNLFPEPAFVLRTGMDTRLFSFRIFKDDGVGVKFDGERTLESLQCRAYAF